MSNGENSRDLNGQEVIKTNRISIPIPSRMPERMWIVPPPPLPQPPVVSASPPSPPPPPTESSSSSLQPKPVAMPYPPTASTELSKKEAIQQTAPQPLIHPVLTRPVETEENRSADPVNESGNKEPVINRRPKWPMLAVLIAVVVVISGAAGFWIYQENLRKAEEQARIAKQEEERKKQIEVEQKAKAEAEARALAEARAKAEAEEKARLEMEAKLRQLEVQTAELARQQEEAQRRQQQAQIARQQEELQKRPQQAQQQKATQPTQNPSPMTGSAPDRQTQGKVAALDPRERCAGKDNFISKANCEVKACQKPDYMGHPYCAQYRQQAGNQ